MRRFLLTVVMLCSCMMMFADRYVVKYQVKGNTSTSHCQTTLELKEGTAEEAKKVLVQRGTVSKANIDKVVIVEIKKAN